eukprot:2800716-Pleurochrysis_carterae.AAC.2
MGFTQCMNAFFHGASLTCIKDTVQYALKTLVCAFQFRQPAPPRADGSGAGASLALTCAYLLDRKVSKFLTLPCGMPSDMTVSCFSILSAEWVVVCCLLGVAVFIASDMVVVSPRRSISLVSLFSSMLVVKTGTPVVGRATGGS